MYKNVTVFCPRCGCCTLEMLTTHSYCTECNYSPDVDDHVHLHARDPITDESAYEMDERSREMDLDADEEDIPSDDDEEEAETFQKCEELRKLKQLVIDGHLDPAELKDEYPEHFGNTWYWNEEDEIEYTHGQYDPDYYEDYLSDDDYCVDWESENAEEDIWEDAA